MLGIALAAGCADPEPKVIARRAALAAAGPERIVMASAARVGAGDAEVVVRAAWGSAPGELGRREEASRPGPMSLAVEEGGALQVLDQVNRRIARFDARGRLLQLIPLEGETAEELAPVGDRTWVLYYEPGAAPGFRVVEHARDGQRLRSLRLDRKLQLITALRVSGEAAAPDVWVELRHEEQVQVVRAGAPKDGGAPALRRLGRPPRGGAGARLLAGREDGVALVRRVDAGRFATRLLEVVPPGKLLATFALESRPDASLYLGLALEDGDQILRVVLVRRPGAAPLTVELAPRATDAFRDLELGPDGSVYQLASDEQGVTVRRWAVSAAGGAR